MSTIETAAPSGDQGRDISAAKVWIICAVLYVALMALALLAPHWLAGPQTRLGRDSELGILESGQNVILLIALIQMIVLAVRAPEPLLRYWAIFIALGTFFLLGEEISWGQHYFGWATTGVWEQINDQGETNLHNTEGGWLDQKPRAILLFGMILGTIVHPLVKHFRKGRGLFDNPWWLAPTLVCLPPVVFSQIGGLPKRIDHLNDALHFLSFSVQDVFNGYRSSELEEFFMYIFFITYTASILKRLKTRQTAS